MLALVFLIEDLIVIIGRLAIPNPPLSGTVKRTYSLSDIVCASISQWALCFVSVRLSACPNLCGIVLIALWGYVFV